MVATGLTMSPGFDSWAPWLLDVFGGRQSARTIHFIGMTLLVLFFVVHILMVIAGRADQRDALHHHRPLPCGPGAARRSTP